MEKVRVPQYLHLSMQLLWFDTEELASIFFFYIFAVLFGGWAWLLLIVGPFIFIQIKRCKPRGYLLHFLYSIGFIKLKGYPGPHATKFHE